MAEDNGESLVGAYFRYVRGGDFVLFNTFLPGVQGEIDVIGIRLGNPRDVYFAEVTTHIEGMTYGGNTSTVEKVKNKLARAQDFAREPIHRARSATRVRNQKEYGDRVQELICVARSSRRATSDPAFRLLQVLTRVKMASGRLQL